MTNEEILAESINRAKKNGFKTVHSGVDLVYFLHDVYMEYGIKGDYSFIFDHDFAKAFFGEDGLGDSECPFCEYPGFYDVPNWQYHLQMMVLEVDPIKYLEKFL